MKKTVIIRCCLISALSFSLYASTWTQSPLDRLVQNRALSEKEGLAEPFKGVTTDGKLISGLFKIRSTGVSTKPVRMAAEAFLNGLGEEQRKKTVFPVDDSEWRKWDNRPFPPFNGAKFKEMSERQRELAFDLLRASLSAKGLQKTSDIMKLKETFAELRNNFDVWGQWVVWITVMGKPSDTEPGNWRGITWPSITSCSAIRSS